MNRKIRYSILGLGALTFVILAPIIVLYVRGVAYDFKTGNFTSTGILSVKAEPRDVSLFLDGELKTDKAEDINFLPPGEYELSLQKDGYFSWAKRFKIEAGKVTSAAASEDRIYLLKKDYELKTLSESVLDFYAKDGQYAYLTNATITVAGYLDFSNPREFPLPKKASAITEAKDGSFLLTGEGSVLLFNAAQGTTTDLSSLFAGKTEWQFSDNKSLLALNQGILYQVNTDTKVKTMLFRQVKTFYLLGSSLYFVGGQEGSLSLNVSRSPYGQKQELLPGLPDFREGRLLVTGGKRVFLLADGNLYLTADGMQKIAGGTGNLTFDSTSSSLLAFSSGEFGYFDGSSGLRFVSRSSQPLANLALSNAIGYAFFSNSSGINAIELDMRDRQNQYVLYPSETVQKFVVDADGQNIAVLDNGELKTFRIR